MMRLTCLACRMSHICIEPSPHPAANSFGELGLKLTQWTLARQGKACCGSSGSRLSHNATVLSIDADKRYGGSPAGCQHMLFTQASCDLETRSTAGGSRPFPARLPLTRRFCSTSQNTTAPFVAPVARILLRRGWKETQLQVRDKFFLFFVREYSMRYSSCPFPPTRASAAVKQIVRFLVRVTF